MEHLNAGILFVLGIGILGGALGAWLFQRLNFPQVVGYIVIGLLIGESGFHIVTHDQLLQLRTLNLFALGIIGFLVGGELRAETFRKYGKQFVGILLGEGLGAFFLVGISITLIMYFITHSWAPSVATGIVFGAIASATDPASTLDVLWEYRSQGVVTTALIAIVALDDALAMTLYGLGSAIASILTGGAGSIGEALGRVTMEIVGAVVLGFLFGAFLNFIIRRMQKADRLLGVAIGTILLAIGIANASGMDVILATMTVGLTLANMAPRRSRDLFTTVKSFSLPIYVIFFVMVGARLSIGQMPWWTWGIVIVYVVGRSIGKMGGAYIGSRLTHAEDRVRDNLGLGLFAQGGIAVGLSIMASQHLGDIPITDTMTLGNMIIFCVTATTLIVQLAGPPFVKLAIKRADEIGRNVTEDDIIDAWQVNDVMDRSIVPIREQEPLQQVFKTFAEYDFFVYPVIDSEGRISGTLSLDDMKDVVPSRDCWDWMVAADLMLPSQDQLPSSIPLRKALQDMQLLGAEALPVVDSTDDPRPVGILDMRKARRHIAEETVRRRSNAAAPVTA